MITLPGPDLLRFGHTIQLVGVIFRDAEDGQEGADLLLYLPGEWRLPAMPLHTMSPSSLDWESILTQTDTLLTEVSSTDNGVLLKAFVRKSQRQVDQSISWNVFRRDGYRCRYCGRADVPLTVDHLVRWEVGGPSTEANMVAACRPCNRTRGDMEYGTWLRSAAYERRSRGLPGVSLACNLMLESTLAAIPRVDRVRSR